MSDKIFVVAGTYDQFRYFIKKKSDEIWQKGGQVSLSDYVYVSGPEVLRGHNKVHGYFYGNFRERKDLPEIVHLLRVINNIPPGTEIIPPAPVVQRKKLQSSWKPCNNQIIVAIDGVTLSSTSFVAVTDGNTIEVELPGAPMTDAILHFQTIHGKQRFFGDGQTKKFSISLTIV